MQNEGRFYAVEASSQEVHRSPELLQLLQLEIYGMFVTPTRYIPDNQVYWNPFSQPGRSGYFSDVVPPARIRLGHPEITPAFIDLNKYIGAFQVLNSKGFMGFLLDLGGDTEEIAIASGMKGDDIRDRFLTFFVEQQKHFLEPTFVLGAAGVLYGNQLDTVTSSFDKTYRLYPWVLNAVDNFNGVVQNPLQIRERMALFFGDWNNQGIFFKQISQDMQDCPGILVTDDTCRAIGSFMQEEDLWNRFAENTMFFD